MPARSIQAAIFDMDGLLLDSERKHLEAFTSALAHFSIPPSDEIYYQTIGLRADAARKVLRQNLETIMDFEAFAPCLEKHQKTVFQRPLPVKKGALETIKQCLKNSIPIAVATSTNTGLAKSRLQASGFGNLIPIVIGGDQVKRGKPEPDIYLHATQLLDVDPTKCIAFEDSENGVKSALAAGLKVVQVPDLIVPNDEFRKLGHLIAPDLLSAAKLCRLI